MSAKTIIILNGFITLTGLLLDVYGIFDLSFFPALFGLILGIVDCVTFLWMREEIRQRFTQMKKNWKMARPHMIGTWLKDMEQGKPEVVASIVGQSVLARVLRLAKKLGYEVVNVSESQSASFRKYDVTFKRK